MKSLLIVVLLLLRNVRSNFESENCDRPLGMESGLIKDEDLTASSTHDSTSVGPQMSRIRNEIEGGAWCPSKPIGPKSSEFLQIDLRNLFLITSIETQGRFDNGHGNEFVEFYQIHYQHDSSSTQWFIYANEKTNKTILKGNLNTYSTEKRFLHRPILAERIRIVPFSSRWRTVCLRVEIYGCSMEKNFSTLSSDKIESTFITFPSLIFFVVFLVLFCSIPFLIGYFLRIFFQKSSTISTENSYSKCSRLKPISSPSNRNRERKRNFDDIVSMGSYIYPITSTTSIRQTSSPSSMFKSDHYAVIDHPTTSNSICHYASSNISQTSSSLFNCSSIEETRPLKNSSPLPPCLDSTKLNRIFLVSQSNIGEIFRGTFLDEQQKTHDVLIKMIKNNFIETSREKFFSELNLLSRLKNENLISILSVNVDRLILVQEHSSCGTLREYFRSLNPTDFSSRMNFHFARQLSNALEFLSNFHLIHNDVAARNCLFYSDFSVKLTDCAMALSDYDDEYWICLNGEKLPLRWMSPERLTTVNRFSSTNNSDIYSFGITLWEFWSRCSMLPFGNLTNEQVYQRLFLQQMTNEQFCFSTMFSSSNFDFPKEIFDLFCQCCQIDGNQRPSMVDLHSYFQRQVEQFH